MLLSFQIVIGVKHTQAVKGGTLYLLTGATKQPVK